MVYCQTYRRRVAPTLVLVAALAAAGCTGKSAPPAARPSAAAGSASPTPSADPNVAAARQEAITAYNGYFQAYAAASAAGNPDDPNLATYAADPVLSVTRHNIRVDFADTGKVQVGVPKVTVTVGKVDLVGQPATVTLNVCLDYRGLSLAYKSNHSPVPNSALTGDPYTGSAVVTRFTDGRWLVTQATSSRDTPC